MHLAFPVNASSKLDLTRKQCVEKLCCCLLINQISVSIIVIFIKSDNDLYIKIFCKILKLSNERHYSFFI